MLTACSAKRPGSQLLAREVEKDMGPFLCPSCQAEVVLRKGAVRIHHFAHKPPASCAYGSGESEAHRQCKMNLYDMLSMNKDVYEVNPESMARSGNIPDVSFMVGSRVVAIEVQRSTLSMQDLHKRTAQYANDGIAVLWLCLWRKELDQIRFSPKQWEKWLHALYFGRVYYYRDGDIIPYHFDRHKLWVEPREWFDGYGDAQSAGGYEKESRRYREGNRGDVCVIPSDFCCKGREAWQGGGIELPRSLIYADDQNKWW